MKKLIFIGYLVFLIGCSDNKSKEELEKNEPIMQTTQEVKVKSQSETIIDKSANAIKDSVDSVAKNANAIKDKIDELAKSTNEMIEKGKEITSKTMDKVTQKVNDITTPNGKILFTPCMSCHGQNGEKKALNVSNIIAGQTKEEIINKLNGYKDGTYGGNMKGVMASQAKTLSSKKIEALAEYISTLK